MPAGQLGVENPQLGTYFGVDYWQCLSGTLRALDLDLSEYQDQNGPVNLHWVSSLHRLQSLSLFGKETPFKQASSGLPLCYPVVSVCQAEQFMQ